jgi:hypothetical protein
LAKVSDTLLERQGLVQVLCLELVAASLAEPWKAQHPVQRAQALPHKMAARQIKVL